MPGTQAAEQLARQTSDLTPPVIAQAASRLLKYGGRFCTVYPARRMFEMMSAMHENGLEPKRVQLVQASPLHKPKIVLIEAKKGAKPGLHFLPVRLLNAD